MAFEFKFPDVGEGIHEGKIVEWLVREGDKVKEDQPLVKVETDKAVVELPSPRTGTILKIFFKKGDTIRVGETLVSIAIPGEAEEKPPAPVQGQTGTLPLSQATEGASEKELVPEVDTPATPALRPLATPHTRALARKMGVDLATIAGSGKNGRITDGDIERAAHSPRLPVTAPAQKPPPIQTLASRKPVAVGVAGDVERTPVSHLRKVIAENMVLSKRISAHVTHVDEADVTELVGLYKEAKAAIEADGQAHLTLLPFFMKAISAALREHPILNASYDEEKQEIVIKKYHNIGIAVDTPEGLVVPVVKSVDKKVISDLAVEIADLALRARERRLELDELRGGSFTVTNIGPLGGIFATPIIRQPELAIVGLFSIQERPAVVDGAIAIRKKMYVGVTFDHRIIDGAEAARFMSDLVRLISKPGLLLVKL